MKLSIIKPPPLKPDPKVRHNQPLSLPQLALIMIILVAGLILSVPIFLCEFTKRTFKEPQDREIEMAAFNWQGNVNKINVQSWK